LSFHEVTALNEDTGGNLWLGTNATGAMKLAHDGFITYDEQDRVLSVQGVFADNRGGVCYRAFVQDEQLANLSLGEKQHYFRFGRYDGRRFTWFTPSGLEGREFGWVGQGTVLQARNGEWWVGTAEGLYRFPAADDFTNTKTSRPLAVTTSERMRDTNSTIESSRTRAATSGRRQSASQTDSVDGCVPAKLFCVMSNTRLAYLLMIWRNLLVRIGSEQFG
jgi:ligand-binding sensor domain-containing protein